MARKMRFCVLVSPEKTWYIVGATPVLRGVMPRHGRIANGGFFFKSDGTEEWIHGMKADTRQPLTAYDIVEVPTRLALEFSRDDRNGHYGYAEAIYWAKQNLEATRAETVTDTPDRCPQLHV